MLEAELREVEESGLSWRFYQFTGRKRLVLWGRALPYAHKDGLVGRFYQWVSDSAWRFYIWRAKGRR